jgi:hypothetical protein
MRGKTLAGIITALVVVVGVVSMAQGPPELSPLPPPPTEESKALPEQVGATPDAPPLPGTAVLPPTATTDDPVQAVEAFVQRNRKEADDAIMTLTQERDSLRARLQKVEAALGRWKAVAGALERSQAEVAETPDLAPADLPDSRPATEPLIAPTIPAPEDKPRQLSSTDKGDRS